MRGLANVFCLFVVIAVISGCAAQNAPPPPTVKVSGKVTLDGKEMADGEARFSFPGQAPRIFPIKAGAFSGEAFVGKNRVAVVLEKDGPPASTDAKKPIKINTIAPKDLEAEVTNDGANTFTFEVNSVR
jgi:hypothetical protein